MRLHNRPFAIFRCEPDNLYRAVCFGDPAEIVNDAGVSLQTVEDWRSGRVPVPQAILHWRQRHDDTTLGAQFGPFAGFQLCQRGDALLCPATGIRVNHVEIPLLPDYRRAHLLAQQQAGLIAQLVRERGFYRSNCHRQAKFGMLINQLFPADERYTIMTN